VCCCEAVQKIPSQRVDPALLQLVLLAAALMTLLNVARSGRYAKRVRPMHDVAFDASSTPPSRAREFTFQRCRYGANPCMDERDREMEDVRLDIQTLRALIDVTLDNRAGRDDILLRAVATVLTERRERLKELRRAGD
jgi:hypothetical protein